MATLLVAAALAGAAATAIVLAPAAYADRGDTPGPAPKETSSSDHANKFTPAQRGRATNQLSPNFSADLPAGWKNEALWARPTPGGTNPFGSGPRPPVVGLD